MQVLGRDSVHEAYRVSSGQGASRVTALVPDRVISQTAQLTGGRGHQTAYEWIAHNTSKIEAALDALRRGQRPAPPFDAMHLAED